MELQDSEFHGFLRDFLAGRTGAGEVRVQRTERLGGGAIQENHALDVVLRGGSCPGEYSLVLRMDSPSSLAVSLSRAQEFALLRTALDVGVKVPEPLWLHQDDGEIGRDFYIMRRVSGTANGRSLVNSDLSQAQRERLLEELGLSLARLHRVRPPVSTLDFLEVPGISPALKRVKEYRHYLDEVEQPQPTLEWALRWLERNAPEQTECVLSHGDFRTGNYMVDGSRLTGILDWEFACWSDPREDIGWFCARCWRFGKWEHEAGGIGSVRALLRGYERVAERRVATEDLTYWRVMATVRWAIIALMQAQRHLSGQQPSLELALTGRLLPEIEMDIIQEILNA